MRILHTDICTQVHAHTHTHTHTHTISTAASYCGFHRLESNDMTATAARGSVSELVDLGARSGNRAVYHGTGQSTMKNSRDLGSLPRN